MHYDEARPSKAKAFFGTPAGNETVHRTVSILRIALFESLSLQQKQISGSPKSVSFLGRGGAAEWVRGDFL